MDEFHRYTNAFGASFLVHEARGICGDDVLSAGPGVVADLVIAHLARDDLIEHGKSAPEATTLIRSGRRRKLDAFYLSE